MSKVLEIKNEIKEAMRSKDKEKLTVLRMLVGSLEKEKVLQKLSVVENLSEDDVIKVIQKEVKALDQEKDGLVKAGRDTSNVEAQELILKEYLPVQLSDSELEDKVKEIIDRVGATSKAEMGKVMGIISSELKGIVDMGKASKKVKELL